ncbi:MAG: beta-lactamase family protein, partial [Candidatus Eremiobacteraeota bacterium]|nr:beta-lactamase family protein [Candidatus Eremiobacteraeota bacterium]MBV9262931.1 beta-lactamase family protein [Candidatus Eremiobacteraeota bacterium]
MKNFGELILAVSLSTFVAAEPSIGAGRADSRLVSALHNELATYLRARGAKEHLSSLSLAVSYRPDLPTITITDGTTTYGGTEPVTPASLYQIGSNTKAFTAVAILRLEAQGRLSIDAPLGRYL